MSLRVGLLFLGLDCRITPDEKCEGHSGSMGPVTTENASGTASRDAVRPYDSRQIANYFIRLVNRKQGQGPSITQAIKLVYMAHGWTLALRGQPLINEQAEAWSYGPVIPTVYYAFRKFGTSNLSPIPMYDGELDDDTKALLDRVYEMYGQLSPKDLSRLTHIKGGPWFQCYRGKYNYSPIPDKVIAAHYQDKWRRAQGGVHGSSTVASG